MKIINLIEDTPGEKGLLYEHGLSFYIETAHHKLLMDTGASDAFLHNAVHLGIDLRAVDTVFLSHGHYDHTGGVMALSALCPMAKIIVQSTAFSPFYNLKDGTPRYIGMAPEIASLPQLCRIHGDFRPDDEIEVLSAPRARRLWPKGNLTLRRKVEDAYVQDDFVHEQYLVLGSENQSRTLISGCAHNGILNILDAYRARFGTLPQTVISGFHTMKKDYTSDDIALITEMGKELAETGIHFYTGHCTGDYPLALLSEILGDHLTVIHSGDTVLA